MAIHTPKFGLGASVLRLEDDRFVRGAGTYTDDEARPELLHGWVLRSPHAHARFAIADLDAARGAPGVRLVMTHADVAAFGEVACETLIEQADGSRVSARNIPLLCERVVRHVGDAVAFVVAETATQAIDAAELIAVDYEPLPAVADIAAGTAEGAPLVWDASPGNVAGLLHLGDEEKTNAAFEAAARTASIEVVQNRLVSNYIEPRSAIGEWSDTEDRYVLITASQGVHGIRDALAGPVLKVDASKLRVVTPDVGGGFGTKACAYREQALVLIAAKRLGAPVKWTADRGDHFVSDAQGRDNLARATMAMDEDGRFLGLRIDIDANMGAYLSQGGPIVPWLGMTMAPGLYDIEAIGVSCRLVFTNTVPVDAYRGAGRPEAAYLIERLVEECALEMGVSPVEIRRRNFIPADKLPYKTATGRLYDTGEWNGHLTEALRRAEWDGFEARRQAARAEGKLRGIGLSTYVEACAFPGSEPAHVRLTEDGRVELRIGTQSNGQGHQTAYAQFVAEALRLDYAAIDVRQGDTDELESGGGTGGSRSIPLGAVSVRREAEAPRRRRAGGRALRHRDRRRRGPRRRHRPGARLRRARCPRREPGGPARRRRV
jgi:aerobic carbon-monoxide dehydrogenase large subunit